MSRPSGRSAILLSTLALAALLNACSSAGGATATPIGGAIDAPTATPASGAIDHATGATDVVLRYEEGGGFLMAGFAATMTPHFTLYGDGTIVYRDPQTPMPESADGISRQIPLRTAKLTEEQIQDVLTLALDEGGLAVAKPEYRYDMVADASTAVFTVSAGGQTKTVSVYALGIDDPNVPDLPARRGFSQLATALTTIEADGMIAATDYQPTAYRGILFESPGFVGPNVRPWPWADITPADFAPAADPDGLQFPHRALTIEEVQALGIPDFEGGLIDITLDDDGTTYQFSLRPLLPDETE